MDLPKDSIAFPEPFSPDFSWTNEKILPKPEKVSMDFSWSDEEGYSAEENERNPKECKDELSKQWNDGLIPYTQENNSTKSVLKVASQNIIVQQVRTMMNQGYTPSVIRERLANTQKPEILAIFKPEIEGQLKMYGSVGRFVLDARGYSDCSEAVKVASKNPYRKYMTHVIGCKCGTPRHVSRVANTEGRIEESNDDGFNSFLTEGKADMADTVPVCPKTGVQILGGEGDIDSEWAGDTMFDVMNASSLDKEEGKKFLASNASPYRALKNFFIAFDESLIPKETELVEAPITEAYVPASMEVVPVGAAPEAEVDINQDEQDSIAFAIPEKQVEAPLEITRGIAPLELDIEKTEPLDVEIVQKDAIHSFVPDDAPVSPVLLVEIGDCEPEVEIGDEKYLDISF